MKKLSYILLIITLITILPACKKTLDVNRNPNSPADVTVVELLPAAQISIGQVTGNYFQIVGGIWAQYWTQNPNSSQYRPFEQYQPEPSSPNNAWQELYSGALSDLQKIVEKAGTAENTRNYTAIAKILQGYTFQMLTDNFGDIPFTEALKGESSNITSPKYDRQEDVYNGIINLVKEGRDLITYEGAHPGSDDLIYNGDMTMWAKFANTLLLRMYLRLSYRNPGLAQSGISALYSDGNGFIILPDETAQIKYTSSPGNTNPLYSEMANLNFTQNLIASATSVDSLGERGDPRLFVFYTGGAGLEQGYYSINPPGSYSTPSATVGGLANSSESGLAPVKFITSYESLFLQAEASARGWAGGDAGQLYRDAIVANFNEYKVALLDIDDSFDVQYYVDSIHLINIAPFPSGGEARIRAIITEKWYAMNGNQNIEAWAEWRRTGYPDFFTVSRASRIGNQFPQRLPYPEIEVTRNLNFPGQKPMTEKVWWDAN